MTQETSEERNGQEGRFPQAYGPAWLPGLLSSLTYTRGSKITVSEGRLYVTLSVPNANRRKDRVHVSASVLLPDMEGPEQFMALLRDLLIKLAIHEVDEFLKLDGKHWREPH